MKLILPSMYIKEIYRNDSSKRYGINYFLLKSEEISELN